MTQVATIDGGPAPSPAGASDALLALIERAARDPAFDVNRIREILTLRNEMVERERADDRVSSFNQAFARAKAEIPVVRHNRDVSFGAGKAAYTYADIGAIYEIVTPVLARYGLSTNWESAELDGGAVRVTCHLRHVGGHSIAASRIGKADGQGGKSAIQADASARTYLKRHTLCDVLGIVTSKDAGEDDDGRAAGRGETITEDQRDELLALADAADVSPDKLCEWLKVEAVADLPADKFARAKDGLERRRAAMKDDAR